MKQAIKELGFCALLFTSFMMGSNFKEYKIAKENEKKELIFTALNHSEKLENILTPAKLIDGFSPIKIYTDKNPKSYVLKNPGIYISKISKSEDGNLAINYTEKTKIQQGTDKLENYSMKINPKTHKQESLKKISQEFIGEKIYWLHH